MTEGHEHREGLHDDGPRSDLDSTQVNGKAPRAIALGAFVFLWVVGWTVATAHRWSASLPGDWASGDRITSALLSHLNTAAFGPVPLLGNTAGEIPHHPGPFYIAIVGISERVASYSSAGAQAPLLTMYSAAMAAMCAGAILLTWKALGGYAAAALTAVIGIAFAFYPNALGHFATPGNEGLQGPAALLAIAAIAGISTRHRTGFIASGIAFVVLMNSHWGGVPLGIALLLYTAYQVVRQRPRLGVAATTVGLFLIGLAPAAIVTTLNPAYPSKILSGLGNMIDIRGGAPDQVEATWLERASWALVTKPMAIPHEPCLEPGCYTTLGYAALAILVTSALGSALLIRSRRWTLGIAGLLSIIAYLALNILADIDYGDQRYAYIAASGIAYTASYPLGMLLKSTLGRAVPGDAALLGAIALLPLMLIPIGTSQVQPFDIGNPLLSTTTYPTIAGTGEGGSVLLIGHPDDLYPAAMLAIAESRAGRPTCLWGPAKPLWSKEGGTTEWKPGDIVFSYASGCPREGTLYAVNPTLGPIPEGSLVQQAGGRELTLVNLGKVQCAAVFPCRDLEQEARKVFRPESFEYVQIVGTGAR